MLAAVREFPKDPKAKQFFVLKINPVITSIWLYLFKSCDSGLRKNATCITAADRAASCWAPCGSSGRSEVLGSAQDLKSSATTNNETRLKSPREALPHLIGVPS